MAVHCETCAHNKSWHKQKGCGYPSCVCTAWVENGLAQAVTSSGFVTVKPRASRAAPYVSEEQMRRDFIAARSGTVVEAILPESRHDAGLVEATMNAASRTIARLQTGTYDLDPSLPIRVAQIGQHKNCTICQAIASEPKRLEYYRQHLTPYHVAELFGFRLDEVRESAADYMEKYIDSGDVAEVLEQIQGYRDFNLSYGSYSNLFQPQAIGMMPIQDTTTPRFWLSGAQGAPWEFGRYAAECQNTLPGETGRDACLRHYNLKNSGTKVNRHSLMVTRGQGDGDGCSCGVYAYTRRENADGYVSAGKGQGALAAVVAFGEFDMGADNASWRASDAAIAQLTLTPFTRINKVAAPVSKVDEVWRKWARVEVEWQNIATELARTYNTAVAFKLTPSTDNPEWSAEPVLVQSKSGLSYMSVEIV